jgi:hypothetical protein
MIRKLKEQQILNECQLVNNNTTIVNKETGTDISENISLKMWLRIPLPGKHGKFLVERLEKSNGS